MATHEPQFTMMLITPGGVLAEQRVTSVTLPAADGRLGVLAWRAPLLCRLRPGVLTIRRNQYDEQLWYVEGGFARMLHDTLTVLTVEALKPSQIDRAAAKLALDQARALRPGDDAAYGRRRDAVTRAKAMLAVSDPEPR